MSKYLELTFTLDDNRTMVVSIPSPKDDLTLETVKAKAEKIMPILESNSGASATALKQARITESTSVVLE